jgi:soluble lytic murein transglycosylase
MDAHFALGLGLPDQAVAVARMAGRDGTVLPQAGWPLAASPPDQPVPAAVALGIIRQESSFDPGAVSPSGARGLMQLMPATARLVGQQTGAGPITVSALTDDTDTNMRLGTAYLGQLIGRFNGSLPLAIAAYNAGPNRVDEWLGENGDPRGSDEATMIDWIELIPFSETRNYVQRVIENIGVYRAKRDETLPSPVTP